MRGGKSTAGRQRPSENRGLEGHGLFDGVSQAWSEVNKGRRVGAEGAGVERSRPGEPRRQREGLEVFQVPCSFLL